MFGKVTMLTLSILAVQRLRANPNKNEESCNAVGVDADCNEKDINGFTEFTYDDRKWEPGSITDIREWLTKQFKKEPIETCANEDSSRTENMHSDNPILLLQKLNDCPKVLVWSLVLPVPVPSHQA